MPNITIKQIIKNAELSGRDDVLSAEEFMDKLLYEFPEQSRDLYLSAIFGRRATGETIETILLDMARHYGFSLSYPDLISMMKMERKFDRHHWAVYMNEWQQRTFWVASYRPWKEGRYERQLSMSEIQQATLQKEVNKHHKGLVATDLRGAAAEWIGFDLEQSESEAALQLISDAKYMAMVADTGKTSVNVSNGHIVEMVNKRWWRKTGAARKTNGKAVTNAPSRDRYSLLQAVIEPYVAYKKAREMALSTGVSEEDLTAWLRITVEDL